jgi:mRNA-degrading endonuclease HigB of HigAB toxin-antitoxin module
MPRSRVRVPPFPAIKEERVLSRPLPATVWIRETDILNTAESAQWKTPRGVKKAHPRASILKSGRVVFNIKANDYRLIVAVQYENGVMLIRFFGSHEEYDKVDAETV